MGGDVLKICPTVFNLLVIFCASVYSLYYIFAFHQEKALPCLNSSFSKIQKYVRGKIIFKMSLFEINKSEYKSSLQIL